MNDYDWPRSSRPTFACSFIGKSLRCKYCFGPCILFVCLMKFLSVSFLQKKKKLFPQNFCLYQSIVVLNLINYVLLMRLFEISIEESQAFSSHWLRIKFCQLNCRFASLYPQSQLLFCSLIEEFGKKNDLRSALEVFEALKEQPGGINMFACRSIIDVCGLCGDFMQSRIIFEVISIFFHFHSYNTKLVNLWKSGKNSAV